MMFLISASRRRLKMKKVCSYSDPAFTEIDFWSNGELEISRTRHWSNGSFYCNEETLSAITETLDSEGEVLVSKFNFEIDFLSNPSDAEISARCINTGRPVDVSEEISLAIAENRIEDIGYRQVDYFLWFLGEISVVDDLRH